VPFKWSAEGTPPDPALHQVIKADLSRSGYFDTLPERDIIEQPYQPGDVNTGTWRRLLVNYVVIGEVTGNPLDGFSVEVHLIDVTNGQEQFGLVFPARVGGFRYTAHYIADRVFEALMDMPGAFRTKIAYVTAQGFSEGINYALMVADADGFNPQPMVTSREPLLSPAWSPNGEKLAYVSFESGNSAIWIQEIASGAREEVASFKGINGAPSFSPDGTRLALTLSKSGDPEIYIMDIGSRRMTRLTHHWAIDTEPVWTMDSRNIVFTSDRGGKPQLYSMAADGDGKPQRLTRQGDYNARASISPDGEYMAFVTGTSNNYRIAVMDQEGNDFKLLSKGPLDESPSFAPNGSMVLYASREGTQGVLSAVPIFGSAATGRTAHQLVFSQGDIREPAWQPIRP
jgi:TolB protein